MSKAFSSLDLAALATVSGGGSSQKKLTVGVTLPKGVNVGGTYSESQTDFSQCLKAIGDYHGKVGECMAAYHPTKVG